MIVSRKDASQQIYQSRINRVIDYISENLAEELSLGQLAAVALPASGYQPAHQAAMEIYLKRPEEIGWTTFDIECRAPV